MGADVLEQLVQLANYEFAGNMVSDYMVSLLILLLYFPIKYLINWIICKLITVFASKTKSQLDDIFVRSLLPSVNFFIFAFLFREAYTILTLSEVAFQRLEGLFNIFLLLPLVYFLIKFSTESVRYYLQGDGTSKGRVDEAAVDLLVQVLRILLIIIGILLLLENLNFKVSGILAGLGVGGLAFALAAQDILKNFFAGVSLIMDKTVRKGDRVKFSGVSGFVNKVTLRTTKIKTYDGSVVTVPNSKISDGVLENISRVKNVKVKMTLGVTYETPLKKLKKLKTELENLLAKHDKIDRGVVLFDTFADSSLNFSVTYYLIYGPADWPQRAHAVEDINFKVIEIFEKLKVDFAYPTQTVFVKK